MSGFANQILGGAAKLERTAIRSPNYAAGSAGWTINKDGSAEFNNATFRGTVVISSTTQSLLVYSGTPAAGNLIASIAAVGGVDSFGNHYLQGVSGYGAGGTMTVADSLANESTRFLQLQAGGGVQLVGFSPDLATWNSGSIESVSGNGHLIITAPQAKLDGGNGAVVTLVPASPAGGANAQINHTADTYAFTATNDTVNITANGAVQVDPANGGSATHAFIAGTIGSGSVNWYRGSANRWKTDDGVDMTGTLTLGASDTGLQRDAAAVIGVTNAVVGHGESWHTPALGSGWAAGPSSGTVQAVQYRQDAEDNIVIVGAIHSTSATPAATIFTLPVGWRPAITQRSPGVVQNSGGSAIVEFVEVNSTGAVSMSSPPAATGKDVYFQVCVPRGVIS